MWTGPLKAYLLAGWSHAALIRKSNARLGSLSRLGSTMNLHSLVSVLSDIGSPLYGGLHCKNRLFPGRETPLPHFPSGDFYAFFVNPPTKSADIRRLR